ncbi:MAG: hypothetical protein CM1200mP30_25480 [Pseudomonadota bacterium]|nr:MAG: hypothetical protein CM1200mP30_25480 [Pseudomonadota bacterium]
MGRAIRATSQNARAARIMGVDTDRVYAFTFSLNAAICGVAGVLISIIWVIQPFFGITHSIRSFVIVTSAGFGNLIGVILSALGLGVLNSSAGSFSGRISTGNSCRATGGSPNNTPDNAKSKRQVVQ